jgi:hypothetical protein
MAIRSLKNGTFSRSLLVGNAYYLPPDYESIATVSLTGTQTTITFSSIPATYTQLQVRYIAASTRSTYGFDQLFMRFNSDTGSNYASHQLIGNGSSATAAAQTSATLITVGDRNIGAAMPSTFGGGVIDILDYANTSKYKTARCLTGIDNNGTYDGTFYPYINFSSGLWQSTNAINSISFTAQNGDFKANTRFALYGIKG